MSSFVRLALTASGEITLDANTSKDQAAVNRAVSTAPISTAAGNELLLAFVAADYLAGPNTTVTGVSGANLTWTLVKRTNAQSGSSEIWRAFAPAPLRNASVTATLSQSVLASIIAVSFTGVDTSGTNGSGAIGATAGGSASTGAPNAALVTTRDGSWVLGIGHDFDNAVGRAPGAGKRLLHQYLTPSGDTYWLQMQNSPTPHSGTSVPISDSSLTGDRYNLAIAEVLPAAAGGGGSGTPPEVTVVAPASGAKVDGKITITAAATGHNASILGVQFTLDEGNLGSEVTAAPYSFTWDTSTVNSGTHLLAAVTRDSAGLRSTSPPVSLTVDHSGNAAVVGSWSSPIQMPAVAVNLILLPNNTLLFYQDGASPTVWDYVKNTFTSIATNQDVFCSGHAALADGKILVAGGFGGGGGQFGLNTAEIFDGRTNSWTSVPNMSYKRWYPTATTLSDGRILVTAGWQTGEHTNAGIPEIYDPAKNSWTKLTAADNPFETYPFIFPLTDGRILHTGGSEYATVTYVLDLGKQAWSMVDSNIRDGGSASMYWPDRIMKPGSAADSQMSGPSARTTFVLDMTQASPAWRQTSSMAYPRSFLNLTSLPDASVLVTGGETDKHGGNVANAVYPAELWSPQTETWTTMAAMRTPREYHSTALLLPDGRVVVSGMGADFGNVPDQTNAEFFSPPYLFKGARPVVTQSPKTLSYGSTFFVATPDSAAIGSVALIRTGAVTHAFDQNARFVPLSFEQASGGLKVTGPANAYLAPPGFYMLFLVNKQGVPLIAPFVQLIAP